MKNSIKQLVLGAVFLILVLPLINAGTGINVVATGNTIYEGNWKNQLTISIENTMAPGTIFSNITHIFLVCPNSTVDSHKLNNSGIILALENTGTFSTFPSPNSFIDLSNTTIPDAQYIWTNFSILPGETKTINLSVDSGNVDADTNILCSVWAGIPLFLPPVDSFNITILNDNTPPIVTILTPLNNTLTNNDTLSVTAYIEDNESGITHPYLFYGDSNNNSIYIIPQDVFGCIGVNTSLNFPWQTHAAICSFTLNISNMTGIYYKVKAGNLALPLVSGLSGLIGESDEFTAFRDVSAPIVTLNSPANNTGSQSNIFSFTALDDNLQVCSLYLDGVNVSAKLATNGSADSFTASLTNGQRVNWKIVCEDSLGNIGESETRTYLYVLPNVIHQDTGSYFGGGSCLPNWSCSAYSSCINGTETRVCTDLRKCGITLNKPNETQTCVNPVINNNNSTSENVTNNESNANAPSITASVIGTLGKPIVFVPLIIVILIVLAFFGVRFYLKKN